MIVTVAVLGAVTFIVVRVVENGRIGERVNSEFLELNSAAVRMAPLLRDKNAGAMYELCVSLSSGMGSRLLVISTGSTVLCDSFSLLNGQDINASEVDAVIAGADTAYGFHLIGGDKPFYAAYYACPIVSAGETIGVMLLSSSIQDVYVKTKQLTSTIVSLSAAAAFLIMLISLMTSRLISRPILSLTKAAQAMAGGNLDVRVNMPGKSEIAQLGDAFNRMGDRLLNIDRERSDFVSNASHELKTPLSSIKILTESLLYQDGVPESVYKEFLTDINSEVDRLNNIISDLLQITKLEDYESALNLETVNVGELVKKTVGALLPLAQKKGVAMTYARQGEVAAVCDAIKIRQAVTNLIDNAIKYTRPGGRVTVTASVFERYARVCVADTGMGIPGDYLNHIFDRFYRVDKARSRDTGGTGLGLYITKKVVLMHGGYVEVESEEGVGSTFTIFIPTEVS